MDRRGPATSVPHVGLKRRIPLCKPPPAGAGFSSQTSRSPPPLASQALPPLPRSASTLSSSLSQQPAFFLAAGAKLTSPARDQTQVQTCAERGRAGAGAVWRARLSAGSGAARALAYPLFLSRMLGHPSESFLPAARAKEKCVLFLACCPTDCPLFLVWATRVGRGKGC